MGITQLPTELLYIALAQAAPKSLEWAENYTQARWFLHLRLTCKSFDSIILDWLLSTLKTGEHFEDLPLVRGLPRPSTTAMCVRLVMEQLQRDVHGSTYSLINTIVDGTDMVVELLELDISNSSKTLQANYVTALISTIVGLAGIYTPLAHLAGIDEQDIEPLDKKDRNHVALIAATNMGRIDVMEKLIYLGADVNFKQKNSWLGPPLYAAAISGQTAAIQLLLDHGVNPMLVCEKNGDTALHYAALSGNESTVALLLSLGLDPDLPNHQEETALLCAAAAGHIAITKMLLAQETNVNVVDASGKTPLLYAAWRKHEDVAQVLLERKEIYPDHKDSGTENMTALATAALTGSEVIFRILLARKDVNPHVTDEGGHTILKHAVVGGHQGIVRSICDLPGMDVNAHGEDGSTPLMWASKEGNEDIVKLLLAQKNIQVNSTAELGLTALMMAVISGNTAVLKAILEHKHLDVNAKCQDTEVLEGASTLGLIAGNGVEDMARLVLEHPDVDPELPDMWGRTPLARAAIQGHVGMVKMLLERNDVSVNSSDANGDTPLIHAAEEGEKLVVQELLNEVQIQVAAINDDGRTALTAAAFQGHECIVQMLLDPNRGYNKKDINQALEAAQREGHKDIQRLLAMELEVLGQGVVVSLF